MAWTPPADGAPCWVELTAVDLARARTFYTTVFGWHFKDQATGDAKMAGFQFPDKGDKLSGGFRKVDAVHTSGASRLYLYVSDLEKTVETIVANGGKMISGVDPEGDSGLYMLAHDTEGNELGIYSMKK